MFKYFGITGLIFWVMLCVSGSAIAETVGTVTLSFPKATALPGEKLQMSVTTSDIISSYAVKADFGGLVFTGVHTADNYVEQTFVKITTDGFTIEVQLPSDAPAGANYTVSALFWSDNADKKKTNSAPIAVSDGGVVANAGEDMDIPELSAGRLNGTGSTGDIDSYEWRQIGGTPVDIKWSVHDVRAWFMTYAVGEAGEDFEFELKVTGTDGSVSTDTVKLHVYDIGNTYTMGYVDPLYKFDPSAPPAGYSTNYIRYAPLQPEIRA